MKSKTFAAISVYLFLLFLSCPARAAHPLITDDTETQGKGKFLLELNAQYGWGRDQSANTVAKLESGQAAAILTYGITRDVDLILSPTYLLNKIKDNDTTIYNENGVSDTTLEVKWRLFEKHGFSLAIKPGMIIPTGNNEKSLGAGRLGGRIFLIATQELGSWDFHGNLGYIRNENTLEERRDIWHASLAATWEAIEDLKLVVNAGIERDHDSTAGHDPAFLIAGVIYSVTQKFDVDIGLKYGRRGSETDFTMMSGLTLRF